MKRVALAIFLSLVVGSCGGGASPSPTPTGSAVVPCGPSEVFTRHDHAHLTMIIRGQLRTLPAFIGITATSICWLHTHDTTGIIHLEAGDNRQLTLGDFFRVWGVALSATMLAGERAGSGESVQATVNQQPYTADPNTIVLTNHEDIVLQLGPPFLQIAAYVWPPGY